MSDTGFSFGDVSDVGFTGLDDTAIGFSDPSTYQDVTSVGSPLQLDTSGGVTDTFSTYDLWDNPTPSGALSLSGVSDPPFASAIQSTPSPGGTSFSSETSNALSALSKFGSSFATLLGSHPQSYSPSPQPVSTLTTGQKPVGAVSGTNLAILLIIAGAVFLLLARGGE